MSLPDVAEHRTDVVVVGGGISGLAAAHRLATVAPHLSVTLLEADDRLGGKVRTEQVDGFLVEAGPDSLMTTKPAARRLVEELGLGERMRAPRPSGGTSVLRRGRLVPVPDGLTGFVPRRLGPLARSRLFSPAAKLRMGLELLVPVRRGGADESLAGFVTRRLGRQAYERMAEPLAGGIFGTDPAGLSLLATMPHLREAEVAHGGLLRASLSQRRAADQGPARDAPVGPPVAAPEGGMAELVTGFAAGLVTGLAAGLVPAADGEGAGARVVLGARVTAVRAEGTAYRLVVDESGVTTTVCARAVVLALPAASAATALAGLAPAATAVLRGFGCASTVTVSLGYRAADLPPLPAGHGYLVPREEGRPARAVTRSSAKYEGRAPAGHELFRVSLGGAGRPELAHLTDDELAATARQELSDTLGIDRQAAPVLTRVHRWAEVMPNYAVGHLDRVRQVEHGLAAHPGVQVAGSAFHGLGIPDCVASGRRAADRVLGLVSSGVPRPPA